ncbi:MAG: adenylyltransferase/cytidyltransferase family protein [Dissulfurispiraceae bacterium]|jgi:FAD synthetase|nr:adenylyltransferase/cytidyltransferase family protein [Dissulfurispiraceae bacterium]
MIKKVVCGGTFDHFHPGHAYFLKEARALGSSLTVVVARDETVLRIKGFLPTDNENDRLMNVQNSGIADDVILGNYGEDLFVIIDEIAPSIIALGYDQRLSETEMKLRFPEADVLRLESFSPEKYKSSYYRKKK